jgi:antitoxin MazE
MKISKWGNSLAIRIPADVASNLGFSEGDEVTVAALDGKLVAAKELTRAEHIARIRAMKLFPAGYKFKRSDVYDEDP